jgi:hypothetical protein
LECGGSATAFDRSSPNTDSIRRAAPPQLEPRCPTVVILPALAQEERSAATKDLNQQGPAQLMDEILRCAQNDGITTKTKATAKATTTPKQRQMTQLKLAATDAKTSWRPRQRLGNFGLGGKAVAEPPHSKGSRWIGGGVLTVSAPAGRRDYPPQNFTPRLGLLLFLFVPSR